MIGYFPDPYPDELFYSLCARYSQRMRYPGKTAVQQELFGLMNAITSIDLPGRLNFFGTVLPPGHSCADVDQVINRHTLWPFYRPFLPGERQQAVLAAMKGVTGYRPDLHAGTAGTDIPRPEWLRFCPKCVNEDRTQFDECYWHRTHQLPGVHLCPTHEVLLENSPVGVGWRQGSVEFIPAETVLQATASQVLPLSHPWHELLLFLSREAAWLLDPFTSDLNQLTLKQRYKIILAEQGLASYTGVVKTRQLQQLFSDFYPAEWLAWLHCSLDGPAKANWLNRLIQAGTRDGVQHPLRHLLFIRFLGYTAQTIFELPLTQQPFGHSPWPCLNPVCPHYHQPVIVTYRLETRPHTRPVATFGCECGYQYRRKGPDRLPQDRFRGKCVAYGPLWEGQLQRLWNDPAQSMARTARQLGVHEQTLQRQAGRLGLPFPAPGSRVVAHSRHAPPPLVRVDPCPPPGPTQGHRARWLEILADHPDLGRGQLQRTFRSVYTWLHRYDLDWLMAHLPAPQKPGRLPKPKTPRLDWPQRDVQLAQQVKQVAQQLRQEPGRPVRISKGAIARQIKLLHASLSTLDRLPLTSNALAEVTEAWQETAVRRVWWAAETYRQEGICPSRRQLITRAGASDGQRTSPLVRAALETALAMLHQNLSLP